MIGVIGLSYKSASVGTRERLALDGAEARVLTERLLANEYFREVVVLSTCNRTEIYFAAEEICSNGAFKVVSNTLVELTGIEEDIRTALFQRYHREAVQQDRKSTRLNS